MAMNTTESCQIVPTPGTVCVELSLPLLTSPGLATWCFHPLPAHLVELFFILRRASIGLLMSRSYWAWPLGAEILATEKNRGTQVGLCRQTMEGQCLKAAQPACLVSSSWHCHGQGHSPQRTNDGSGCYLHVGGPRTNKAALSHEEDPSWCKLQQRQCNVLSFVCGNALP